MDRYYYAVASLPLLMPDSQPNTEQFLEICDSNLTAEDYAAVVGTVLVPGKNDLGLDEDRKLPTVSYRWYAFETVLRNAIVKYRAVKLGKESEDFIREDSQTFLSAEEAVRTATQGGNPLETEQLIDRARWAFLEELETGHYFDLEKIIIYYLKLQLLEKRAKRTEEKGESDFQEIYDHIMEEYQGYIDGKS